MKTIYINKKGRITKRKIRRIAKKISKKSRKEDIAVAICKDLSENEELLKELENTKQVILNRKMAI